MITSDYDVGHKLCIFNDALKKNFIDINFFVYQFFSIISIEFLIFVF